MSNIPVTAEDLYLYAMQLLDEAEQTRIEEFLKQSPEARSELVNVRGDLGLLAMTVEQQAPPSSARQRLMKQVAREQRTTTADATDVKLTTTSAEPVTGEGSSRQLKPIQPESYATPREPIPFRPREEEAPRTRGFVATAAPWLGWAIAAGLAVSTWDFYHKAEGLNDQVAFANATSARATATSAKAEAVLETMRSGSAQRFLLTRQNTQPVPSARVTYLAESGSLVFQGNNLDPLPPYKTYELWLIPVGKAGQPIPAGTFKPDGHGYASIILPDLPKGVVAGTFGVTMEDDGGAQSPTLPILMIGS
jgi:hypothetical protein